MEEQDMKQLTFIIAGRPYPLKIKANDEPVIRKIIKEVNEKINRFQLTYPNRDKQDCLSMSVLAYAVDLHKANSRGRATQNIDDPQLSEKLSKLEELLDGILE